MNVTVNAWRANVKVYEVSLSELAQDDLAALYDWIAENSGSVIAHGYILRVKQKLQSLKRFPHRGTRRDDIGIGLRTFGLDRRVTIAFRVDPGRVTILRVLYGGRDLRSAFRP